MKLSTFFKIGVVVGAIYSLKKAFEAKTVAPKPQSEPEFDPVHEAMLESFPASDPPAYR